MQMRFVFGQPRVNELRFAGGFIMWEFGFASLIAKMSIANCAQSSENTRKFT